MSRKFSVAECKELYHLRDASFVFFVGITNGNFVIVFNEDAILQSEDYYFERAIAIKYYSYYWGQEKITIAYWYLCRMLKI